MNPPNAPPRRPHTHWRRSERARTDTASEARRQPAQREKTPQVELPVAKEKWFSAYLSLEGPESRILLPCSPPPSLSLSVCLSVSLSRLSPQQSTAVRLRSGVGRLGLRCLLGSRIRLRYGGEGGGGQAGVGILDRKGREGVRRAAVCV
jgi:hypothetical protein